LNRNYLFQFFIIFLPLLGLIFLLPSQQTFVLVDLTSQNSNYDRIRSSNSVEPSFDAQDLIGLAPNLWNGNLTGKGVTVAVLDTGISPNHQVFTNDGKINWTKRIIAFYSESIDGLSPNPTDIQWHGTWAASILGGNSSIYQGVAPAVKFVIMQIFEEINGQVVTTLSLLNQAVDWILTNKDAYNISIVNMSFGIDPTSTDLQYISQMDSTVEKLVNDGILVVVAAGNNGDEGIKTINAPGSSESVLTVGGVDDIGNMYSKSSIGPTYEGYRKPDVCAPAVSILGAYPGNIFAYATGTSASTPLISGLAALMLEKDPALDPLELKNIISLTSYRTIDPLFITDNHQGWGIVQGYASLAALEPPITLTQNTKFQVELNENYSVFCQPIRLRPDHYFIESIQKDSLPAEMYLFDKTPNPDGTPKLVASTINSLDISKIMGVSPTNTHDYYLVLKSSSKNSGGFEIRLIIDLRGLILLGFTIFNMIGIIYVSRWYWKTQRKL
jgi:serine protease AprX